jgi:translation elongation factor EF-1beta
MIVFDVKVYEMETDLNELFKKITTEIAMDGLVWNNEPKILPIAYGMNKLQVGCVVEDSKVSVDDIYEKIEAWEDLVQSIDTVSFQKL